MAQETAEAEAEIGAEESRVAQVPKTGVEDRAAKAAIVTFCHQSFRSCALLHILLCIQGQQKADIFVCKLRHPKVPDIKQDKDTNRCVRISTMN